jgi:ABC-type microcin C transport system duplicated ATPase subunit YejF
MKKQPLLTICDLSLSLGTQQILDHVSLDIYEGETVALVGRSGSGKSMTAHALMQLLPPGVPFKVSGHIEFQGQQLLDATEKEMQRIRGSEIGMVFQEALHALDPLMKIGNQILESLPKNTRTKGSVYELMSYVGIADPKIRYHQYPHEFSGGMCQRVMIAIALAGNPKLLIADEPTTALDVTIQAQIIDLLQSIQQERKMGILLITHDLGIVAGFSDRVYVMDQGKIVEHGDTHQIFMDSQHEFTKQLIGMSTCK